MNLKLTASILLSLLSAGIVRSQAITGADGMEFGTRYCWVDSNYALSGTPAGGIFSGCGITEQNGQWYFNSVLASSGITVFPYACAISYTLENGAAITQDVLVWKPVLIMPPLTDSFTCDGNIILEASMLYAGAYEYIWTPAAPLERSDTSISNGFINATTTFVITARDYTSNCMGSDTVTIYKYPIPEVNTHPDTTIMARAAIHLWATGGTQYIWTPGYWLDNVGSPNPVAQPQAPVTYTVRVTNEYGCSDTASVHINIIEDLLLPNAFTPNGDGINDVFRIVNYGYQQVIEFSIYNRWGERVFTTYDGTHGWDGMVRGKAADAGTYFYRLQLVNGNGITQNFKGELSLIR